MHCKLVCLGFISAFGGVQVKLSWYDLGFLLVTASSVQLWAGLSWQSTSGLP